MTNSAQSCTVEVIAMNQYPSARPFASTSLVILACVAILFSPILAAANCCCNRDGVFVHEQSPNPVPPCCQSRCSQSLESDPLPSVPFDSLPCRCHDCDSKAVFEKLTTTIAPDSVNFTISASLSPHLLDWSYTSTDVEVDGRHSFLYAQEHCARLCRWRK